MDRLGKMAGSQAIMIKAVQSLREDLNRFVFIFPVKIIKEFPESGNPGKEGEEVNVLMDYTSPEKHLPVWQLSRQSFTLKKGKSTSGSGAAVRE